MSSESETFQFDEETAIASTGLNANGDHQWDTHLTSNWNIGENPNGGYLSAALVRAKASLEPTHPDPLTVTTHYLRPGGSATDGVVSVEPIRTGRTLSTMRGRLDQVGKTRIETIASFTDLSLAEDRLDLSLAPVDLPDPDDCIDRNSLDQGVDISLLSRVEMRVDPKMAVAGEGERAEIHGWIRFSDGRPPDAQSLILFADAFPPPLFTMLGNIGWVPTIELTVHIRRRPVAGWIRGKFEVQDVAGNRMIEDGTLWDESGAVVARSRQVGLILTPES